MVNTGKVIAYWLECCFHIPLLRHEEHCQQHTQSQSLHTGWCRFHFQYNQHQMYGTGQWQWRIHTLIHPKLTIIRHSMHGNLHKRHLLTRKNTHCSSSPKPQHIATLNILDVASYNNISLYPCPQALPLGPEFPPPQRTRERGYRTWNFSCCDFSSQLRGNLTTHGTRICSHGL